MCWKFTKARAYEAPPSLIASWWQVLRDAGFSVDIEDPPDVYVDDSATGARYFRGTVNSHEGCITVIAMRGPIMHSPSLAAGKELILLGYSKPNVGYAMGHLDRLVGMVGAAIIAAGGKELSPPESVMARCLRLIRGGR